MALAEVRSARDLRTGRDVVACYARTGSAAVLGSALGALVAARAMIGAWSAADLVVVAISVVLTGFVEWVVHRHLLHAPEMAWTSRRLGTGSGHRLHHADPIDLAWLLLPAADAAAFLVALGIFTVAWTVPLGLALGAAVVGPAATGLVAMTGGLVHYELVHLLAHSSRRPRHPYYARLVRNHRRHHHIDERRWMGVTSNLGDRVLRTLR